jgi:hypothetical protein
MDITVEINEDLLNEGEKNRLIGCLDGSEEQIGEILQNIIKASFNEYKEMLLGKGLPTRADEIKQHRLLHLIKYYFNGKLPTETQVSLMFQLTESESRSLIKNVKTRFRYQLEKEISHTLQDVVSSWRITDEREYYEVVIESDNIHEELNRIITVRNPSLEPIKKLPSAARKFKITADTYQLLKEQLIESERT